VTLDATSFEGHECVRHMDESASVMITTSTGPRILGLTGRGDNLLAVLPDGVIELPGGGTFRMIGGHRLWAAPEVPELTYLPDDKPCVATEVEGGVRVTGAPDDSGLIRSLEVTRMDGGWVIDHLLSIDSGGARTLAPWGITQFRLGGEVELSGPPPGTGFQADRAVVLWPYTDPGDGRLSFGSDGVRIRAHPGGDRLKLGLAPGDGHIRYRIDGEVFEKTVAIQRGMPYSDLGAVTQVYLCDDFVELETLGPLTELRPGEEVHHRELWTVRADD
jgi:hypothetical protein